MAAINSLLSQELQASCRYNKDGATVGFTATLSQGPDSQDGESILQRKIERIIQTTKISDADLPGRWFVVLHLFLQRDKNVLILERLVFFFFFGTNQVDL